MTIVWERTHDNPCPGEILVIERVRLSESPFRGRTANVDVPLASALTVTDPGSDFIEKSCTVTIRIVVSETWPLVPVTCIVYVPIEPLHVKVETPEVCTVVVDRAHERPPCGETIVSRLITLLKPFFAFTVMVDKPFSLGRMVRVVGSVEMVKIWIL